ncbi:autotransporter domain-containing protein [uncultured Desulfuromonas sp.]|uniref:autotransporter domain-containing protein n=1 Tax=uncultured Desulfuromonas sp. TaxID=181013 RepID=UPI002AABA9E0|nr:autotransporter domain-containing protein [uncultured Desulfuromonas sp.]
MTRYFLLAVLCVAILFAQPLQASDVVEVGVFQIEFLGPGDSAIGGTLTQFDDPDVLTGTTAWSAEQKDAVIRSLEVLNSTITNQPGRTIRIAMAWRDDLPEDNLGVANTTALTDLATGQGVTTAEAAWRDGDTTDYFPQAADVLIRYNVNKSYYFDDGLPGNQSDFSSVVIHEIFHGLGITSGYWEELGFLALSRWDSLIEDVDGNRPQAGTFGTPEALTVIGPEGTLLWLGEYANSTYGGQMPITTLEDQFKSGSSLIHTGPDGELMSWFGHEGKVTRAPNKLLLDVLRDLGWGINMDFYNAFGATYYRDDGTIEEDDDFLTDYDYTYAFYVNGDGNRIVQKGALESRGDFSDTVRLVGENNVLDLTGSLTATGDHSTALYLDGFDNRISVRGEILVQGEGAVGIYVPNELNDIVLSEATITADTAVYFMMFNRLFLGSGCQIDGDLIAEGYPSVVGFGYVIDEEGSVVGRDSDFSFRFDDDIVGNWLGYLGAGELSLNGHADFEALTIREQGTLKGTGTIHGPVLNQGAVAPGNSIGTLTIDGDYTQESGAVLEIEAGDGSSDLLRVTGTADLQGGTLVLLPSGYLTSGHYTILEAGTLQGAFDALWNPAVFNVVLNESLANSLVLDIERNTYASLAATAEQVGLAQALDGQRLTASGDEAVILNTLDSLSLSDLHTAMDDLTPRIHNSVTTATLDAIHQRNTQLLQRLGTDQPQSKQQRVWVRMVGDNARYDDVAQSPAFRAKTTGIMMGVEQQVTPALLVGMAGAYTNSDLHELDGASTADRLSWDGYLYSHWDNPNSQGGWFAQTAVGIGTDSIDTKRAIAFFGREAESEHDASHGAIHVNSGYRVTMASWNIVPTVGLEYLWMQEDGFTEQRAQSASLRISDKDSELLRSVTGFKIEHSYRHEKVTLLTQLGAVWHHAFNADGEQSEAAFIDSGESFRIDGRDGADDGVELSLFFNAAFTNGITTRLGYQRTVQESGGYRTGQFSLGVEWLF